MSWDENPALFSFFKEYMKKISLDKKMTLQIYLYEYFLKSLIR